MWSWIALIVIVALKFAYIWYLDYRARRSD